MELGRSIRIRLSKWTGRDRRLFPKAEQFWNYTLYAEIFEDSF
jgi:hypothetical protein